MKAIIFDIQRFSIYDGPGIRTNVFLKGCNLKCLWCHNPESQNACPQIMIRKNKCTGCGKCKAFCDKAFTDNCTRCGKCASLCKSGAREIAGKEMTADEVLSEVIKDKSFYETSGGGVTLSGGEPLLQIDFAEELLKKCKENGINTCIETAGNVPYEYFDRVLPYLDNILCDVKCIDEALHKRLTGVSNKRILDNAGNLKNENVNLVFRMPVIPTLNDGEVSAVKDFCGDTPLELLAYHNTASDKYKALGKDYTISEIIPPTKEYMTELASGLNCIYSPTGI